VPGDAADPVVVAEEREQALAGRDVPHLESILGNRFGRNLRIKFNLNF
jgi:hypothetical protein